MKEFLNRLSLTAALAFQPVPESFRHDLVPTFLKTCIKEVLNMSKELELQLQEALRRIERLEAAQAWRNRRIRAIMAPE